MIGALLAAALSLPAPGGAVVTARGGRPLASLDASAGFGLFDAGLRLDLFRNGLVRPGLLGRWRALSTPGFDLSASLELARAVPLPSSAGNLRRVVATWDSELGLRGDFALPGSLVLVAEFAALAVTDLTAEHTNGLLRAEAGVDWAPLRCCVLLGRLGRLSGANRGVLVASAGAGVRF